MIRVITFGTFDVFHAGHLSILERSKSLGDYLIVGVSSDAFSTGKKKRTPIYSENDRMRIISALACVGEVFLEESLEQKEDYIRSHAAHLLVMGDDWRGKFDDLRNICDVIYLPRTPSISTTAIVEVIKKT